MGGGEMVIEVCPLCKRWFSIMTKKLGFVIDSRDSREIIRVCLDCDVVYNALCELKW
jgi:hypothetical protein